MFRIARTGIIGVAAIAVIGFAATLRVDISALWTDPSDIASRDLFYGPGGPESAPRQMEFEFVEEDTSGTTPKYYVRDKDGVLWKMKLGVEARPEVAASRLIWAAGYYPNPHYFLASAYIKGVPSQLRRGRNHFDPVGGVHHVRLMRMDAGTKIGSWKWKESPFAGTKEFNGLRVLMAVVNNWDLKDTNNAIIRKSNGKEIHCVSDLGASFGGGLHTKGDAERYETTSFIEAQKTETVDLAVPKTPPFIEAVAIPVFARRLNMRWISQDIPRGHARWMGEILARISRQQIGDIFKASGFAPEEIEAYTRALESRIAALRAL